MTKDIYKVNGTVVEISSDPPFKEDMLIFLD